LSDLASKSCFEAFASKVTNRLLKKMTMPITRWGCAGAASPLRIATGWRRPGLPRGPFRWQIRLWFGIRFVFAVLIQPFGSWRRPTDYLTQQGSLHSSLIANITRPPRSLQGCL